MVLNAFFLCAGFLLLYYGSEWMVRGAADLAISLYVRPIMVGLTVVAFATSAPELLVSIIAAVKGASGVSLGNIVGSNVANAGLVIGASALIRPLRVDPSLIRRDIPFMLGVTLLFWILSLDGRIGRGDGFILVVGLASFVFLGISHAVRESNGEGGRVGPPERKIFRNVIFILLGMGGLLMGADLIVRSAMFFARYLGLSELFIGLTIVAVGTSLPELATSMVAGAKGEADISIGNVVGSNVFNICMVMGAVGLLNPVSVERSLMTWQFPVLLLFSFILFVFCRTGFLVSRGEGGFFLAAYFSFLGLSYWSS